MNGARDSINNAIYSGRAVLLAGHGVSAVSAQQILTACAFSGPPAEGVGLQGYLNDPVQGEKVAVVVDRLERQEGNSELRRICSAPWGLVVSTAIDTSIARALNETNRDARRLRHHFVDQAIEGTLPKRPQLLDVAHLARVTDPHRPLGAVTYGRRWRNIRQLSQPALLRSLAAQIGPAHIVCVAGINLSDIVDWRLVATSLVDLDPERVIWFLEPGNQITSEELLTELPGITLVRDSLDAVLRAAEDAPIEKERLAALKSTVLDTDDLVVNVRVGDANRPVVFRSAELRDFRRHVEVLPDLTDRRTIEESGERKTAFVEFLGRPRVRPDYENIGEGFCFTRDAYDQCLDLINKRLRQKQSDVQNARKGSPLSGPILLVGGAGSGRTIGLHWLGLAPPNARDIGSPCFATW
jgi:hypothetical protein